jgi:hypothetical protein
VAAAWRGWPGWGRFERGYRASRASRKAWHGLVGWTNGTKLAPERRRALRTAVPSITGGAGRVRGCPQECIAAGHRGCAHGDGRPRTGLDRRQLQPQLHHPDPRSIPCRRIVAAGSEGGPTGGTTLSRLFYLEVLMPLSSSASRNGVQEAAQHCQGDFVRSFARGVGPLLRWSAPVLSHPLIRLLEGHPLDLCLGDPGDVEELVHQPGRE